jgi:hypothetical protein
MTVSIDRIRSIPAAAGYSPAGVRQRGSSGFSCASDIRGYTHFIYYGSVMLIIFIPLSRERHADRAVPARAIGRTAAADKAFP